MLILRKVKLYIFVTMISSPIHLLYGVLSCIAATCPDGDTVQTCKYNCVQMCLYYNNLPYVHTVCSSQPCIPGCDSDVVCDEPYLMMDVGLCVMPAQCSCMDHLGNEVLVRNKSKIGMENSR